MPRRAPGSGTVYRTKAGYWTAEIRVPGEAKPRSFTRRDEAAVRAWLDAAAARAASGLPPVDPAATLGAYLTETWLPSKAAKAENTRRTYASLIRSRLIPALGKRPLARLSAREVETYLARELAAGVAPKTLATLKAILRAAYDDAERWELVARNPARLARLPAPALPVKERAALSAAEARAFLAAVADSPDRALYLLAFQSGARLGELLGARWRDLDLERATWALATKLNLTTRRLEARKTKNVQTVPLLPETVAALRSHRAAQAASRLAYGPAWADNDLVFAAPGGVPRSGHVARTAYRKALAKAGLPAETDFHAIRHTVASLLMEAGVPLPDAKAVLGHRTSAVFLDLYAHARRGGTEAAVRSLGALLAPETESQTEKSPETGHH